MHVLLVESDPKEAGAISRHTELLAAELQSLGHTADTLSLRKLKLYYCIGCWGCWVKTPGTCSINDDSWQVVKAIAQTDFVLFAAPLVMGFPNALMKNAHDKMIALVHPYIELVNKEMHHRKRYSEYPGMGLLVHPEEDTDSEDMAIVQRLYTRMALNMRTAFHFLHTTETPIETTCYEVDDIFRHAQGA